MHYTQGSCSYLIDRSTYQFVPLGKQSAADEITVPFYFWWHPKGVGNRVESNSGIRVRSNKVRLNRLEVSFTKDYSHCLIDFWDKAKGGFSKIMVESSYSVQQIMRNGKKVRKMYGVQYDIAINDKSSRVFSAFDTKLHPVYDFHWVVDLGHAPDKVPNKFSYGVCPEQYSIIYNYKELSGKTLAMLCGPFAILLDDDLTFDSLVLLKGAKTSELCVDRFVYTVNSYIMKIMMLSK